MKINPLKKFLMTGRLGAVKLGIPIADVLSVLGKPEGTGKGQRGWTIESYSGGSFQVAYSKGLVGLIGIYFDPDRTTNPILPRALSCEVPFSAHTTAEQFRAYLGENGISYSADKRLPDMVAFKTKGGVVASFEDDTLRSLLLSA